MSAARQPWRGPGRVAGAALLLLAALAAPAARAAPADEVLRGEQVYARCLGCHAPARDSVGPRHCGLLGRRAGTVAGFAYSRPMRQSGLVWDGPTLDRFLAAPTALVPGTDMTYDGVADARERRDLIAYLRQLDATPACQALRQRAP